MKVVHTLLFAFSAFSYVCSEDDRGDLCEGDNHIPYSKLPADVQSDLYKILIGAANALGGSCLGVEPNYEKIELLLFTNDPDNYTRLDPSNPVGIDNDTPLYILSHGWMSGFNGYKIKAFRDKYVELYGKNILFVNWGKLAWYPYTTAACNIPYIGQYLAHFLCILSDIQNYDISKVHMIGHSLGGQLSGITGKGVQQICNKKMGRITALDPAGPMFQISKEASRLAPTDAEFVEVVHSNSGLFGFLGKAGTVDYHLNCGSVQPGCFIPQDLSQIAETSIYMLVCHHMRSVELWPYVLETTEFKAKSCKWCPFVIPGMCLTNMFGANFVSLGHTYTKPPSEQYNLVTGPYAPFRLGCGAFRFQGCL